METITLEYLRTMAIFYIIEIDKEYLYSTKDEFIDKDTINKELYEEMSDYDFLDLDLGNNHYLKLIELEDKILDNLQMKRDLETNEIIIGEIYE